MRTKHIFDLLDSKPFTELTREEQQQIQTHIETCQACFSAFEASKIASILFKAKHEEIVLPPPYFHTRVLAAVREKSREKIEVLFSRLWRATAPLLISMIAIVILLAAITLISPSSSENISSADLVSTEMVILNERNPKELTNDQVFLMLYEGDRQKKR